jgi:hypothetical protein
MTATNAVLDWAPRQRVVLFTLTGQISNKQPSFSSRWIVDGRVKTKEFHDAGPIRFGRVILVLFPFLNGPVRNADVQQFG